MKQLQEFFIHKESQSINSIGTDLMLFFRNHGEKYGFNVCYHASSLGMSIGLNYEWPEAPEDGGFLKSSMITGYQFQKFNYQSSSNFKDYTFFLLIFKYRDHFYTNFVVLNELSKIEKAELMQFESKETLLEFADNQLWIEFSHEVNRFLGR